MVQQKLSKNLKSCVKFWKTKNDVIKVSGEWDMRMEQLKALQQSFNEEKLNQINNPKPYKYYRKILN